MRDTLLAERLAVILKADAIFAGLFTDHVTEVPSGDPRPVNIAAGHAGVTFTKRPSLTLSGEYKSYGPRRLGTLDVELHTAFVDATARYDLVDAIWEKLVGSEMAKATVRAALAQDGYVTLGDYGAAAEPIVDEIVENEVRSVLKLRVVWAFV